MTRNQPTRVTIHSAGTGQFFGVVGLIRSAKNGRKLAVCDTVRANGYHAGALHDARALAEARGYVIDERDDGDDYTYED